MTHTRYRVPDQELWEHIYGDTEPGRYAVANAVATATWHHIDIESTAVNPPGQVDDPDFNPATASYDFPDNKETVLYTSAFTPTDMLIDSPFRFAIHWLQSSAGSPNLIIKYKYCVEGSAISVGVLDEVSSIGERYTYSSGVLHQVSYFAPVAGPNDHHAVLSFRVHRDPSTGDTLTGDLPMLTLEIAYLRTQQGLVKYYGE